MFSKWQPGRIITVVTALNLTTSKKRTKRKATCMMGGATRLELRSALRPRLLPSTSLAPHPEMRLQTAGHGKWCPSGAMASGAPKLGVQHDRTLISWEKEVFSCCRQPLSLRASGLFQSFDPSAPLLCNRRFPQCSLQRCAPKDIYRFELLNAKVFLHTMLYVWHFGSFHWIYSHKMCPLTKMALCCVPLLCQHHNEQAPLSRRDDCSIMGDCVHAGRSRWQELK